MKKITQQARQYANGIHLEKKKKRKERTNRQK